MILYELFDEMMDYGYPQISDENILKEYAQDVYINHYAGMLTMMFVIDILHRKVTDWRRQPDLLQL